MDVKKLNAQKSTLQWMTCGIKHVNMPKIDLLISLRAVNKLRPSRGIYLPIKIILQPSTGGHTCSQWNYTTFKHLEYFTVE